jgi:hypothetical protein
MPYKVSGSTTNPINVTVLDMDGNLHNSKDIEIGDYEILNLAIASGIVFCIEEDGEIKGYSNINFIPYDLIATGGTITTTIIGNDTYEIRTFTSSGVFNVINNNDNIPLDYLIVGGGGGGGWAQATGGAGGTIVSGTMTPSVQSYVVTVGAGGGGGVSGHSNGYTGASSIFGAFTATGGTGGGTNQNPGPSGNGYTGGALYGSGSSPTICGGGAGGGGNGGAASSTTGGVGGAGRLSTITGASVYYAGGGGGGCYTSSGAKTGGAGGSGGGGHGSNCYPLGSQTAGTANTGGGGGGGGQGPTISNGSAGGSGIVIIRYKIS